MGVTRHELTGKARPRRISDARAIFSYICRKKGLSHKRIGIILNKDHSSIISAERRVMVLMKYDPNIRKIIESFNV